MFLTIFGISVGVCVCIIMLGIGESIKNSFKDVYGKRQIDIIVQEKDQLSILLSRVDTALSAEVQKMPAVADAAATLLYIHKVKRSAVPVFGWEPDCFLFDAVELISGRRPSAGKKEVMVGEALMRSLKKEGESQLKIKGVVFDIAGVYKSTSPFEQFAAVATLPDLQATIREPGKASFINVRLNPPDRTEARIDGVARDIESGFSSVSAMRADTFIAEKTKFIVVGEQFSLLVSLITVIAVALGLANTMIASTFEKRKFLSILLALGWQKAEVAALFIGESLIIAILGGALGVFLGFKGTGYVFSLTSIQAFVPVLNAVFMLKITGIILGSAVFAALVPAWLTLSSNPVEIIRGE